MRPYRRRYHASWRTRGGNGFVKQVREYLEPFVYFTKTVWRMNYPFPLTTKIFITFLTWFILFLPLCYFLVPPMAAVFLLNYFSLGVDADYFFTLAGEKLAQSSWSQHAVAPLQLFDVVIVFCFLYDFYHLFLQF